MSDSGDIHMNGSTHQMVEENNTWNGKGKKSAEKSLNVTQLIVNYP